MRPSLIASLLLLAACSPSTEGPTPKVIGTINPRQPFTTPARVCNAQGGERGWRINLIGERFTPVPQDVLTGEPVVGLPEVTLKGPATFTLPGTQVLYRDSEVRNLGGGAAELADLLLVVSPPTVTRVTAPQGFNSSDISPLVVEGLDFQTDTFPVMKLLRAGAEEVEVFTLSVDSPTRISTELPPGTPAGTYDFMLTNPEGCSFTLPNALMISYP